MCVFVCWNLKSIRLCKNLSFDSDRLYRAQQKIWNSIFFLPFEKLFKIEAKNNQTIFSRTEVLHYMRACVCWSKEIRLPRPDQAQVHARKWVASSVVSHKKRKVKKKHYACYMDTMTATQLSLLVFLLVFLIFLVNSMSFQVIHALTVIIMFHLYDAAISQRVLLDWLFLANVCFWLHWLQFLKCTFIQQLNFIECIKNGNKYYPRQRQWQRQCEKLKEQVLKDELQWLLN